VATTSAIVYSPDGLAAPDVVERWLAALGLPVLRIRDAETLMSGALRARPRVVVFDSRSRGDDTRAALTRLKSDSYTGVVPAVVISLNDSASFDAGFRAGADEVVRDDFIFIMPMETVSDVCAEIVSIFDTLIPFQYSEQDRRAGYFFGKDRRGQLHRVPLMTVSIGVVTNERRRFTHAAQVSALATEMKSYAKTLPGSVFSIDRRTDSRPADMPAVGVSTVSANAREGK
jgi:hypothetical protein